MPIRQIARALYQLQKEVERLEAALENAPWEGRPEIEDRLRKARAERDAMRRILDGKKGM